MAGARWRKIREKWVFVAMILLVAGVTVGFVIPWSGKTAAVEETLVGRAVAEVHAEPSPEPTPTYGAPFKPMVWSEVMDDVDFSVKPPRLEHGGLQFDLSLDPQLQQAAERHFASTLPISGAAVVLQVKTGRILAIVERRNGDSNNPLNGAVDMATSAAAPAASLMKFVTAAAAFEKSPLRPETDMPYRGPCGRLAFTNWIRNPMKDRRHLTVAQAFGKSCNAVFAHMGLYWTGLPALHEWSRALMFERQIPSDLAIEVSRAALPDLGATPYEVGAAAAGFGPSRLSVLHATLFSAAAVNDGVAMTPHVVDVARNSAGAEVFRAESKELSRFYSKQTADWVWESMRDTVVRGTSRRYFRRPGTRNHLPSLGGKTGTLLDAEEREILYSWFSGATSFGTDDDIAVAVLVGGDSRRLITASAVAQAIVSSFIYQRRR